MRKKTTRNIIGSLIGFSLALGVIMIKTQQHTQVEESLDTAEADAERDNMSVAQPLMQTGGMMKTSTTPSYNTNTTQKMLFSD